MKESQRLTINDGGNTERESIVWYRAVQIIRRVGVRGWEASSERYVGYASRDGPYVKTL